MNRGLVVAAWMLALVSCDGGGDDDGGGPPASDKTCIVVLGQHDSCDTECTTEDGIEVCSTVCHTVSDCGDCTGAEMHGTCGGEATLPCHLTCPA